MEKAFNLKRHMKRAFYEDVRGYWMGQERAWMDKYKEKVESGTAPQSAWTSCLEEYNTGLLQDISKK
ncbi:MAG TPA: hypothetical protein VMW10_05405 [Alphaproteobacteria bacterium]|nr:hypothetical protein [Alphaproteobacteria bacterium]